MTMLILSERHRLVFISSLCAVYVQNGTHHSKWRPSHIVRNKTSCYGSYCIRTTKWVIIRDQRVQIRGERGKEHPLFNGCHASAQTANVLWRFGEIYCVTTIFYSIRFSVIFTPQRFF